MTIPSSGRRVAANERQPEWPESGHTERLAALNRRFFASIPSAQCSGTAEQIYSRVARLTSRVQPRTTSWKRGMGRTGLREWTTQQISDDKLKKQHDVWEFVAFSDSTMGPGWTGCSSLRHGLASLDVSVDKLPNSTCDRGGCRKVMANAHVFPDGSFLLLTTFHQF